MKPLGYREYGISRIQMVIDISRFRVLGMPSFMQIMLSKA